MTTRFLVPVSLIVAIGMWLTALFLWRNTEYHEKPKANAPFLDGVIVTLDN